MTNKRKALLAAAVAALLTVPGVALASGAFDGGDGHSATVDEVTTIGESTSLDISDDSVADESSDDQSDDLDEATEVEDDLDDDGSDDQSDDLDEATEVEDDLDDDGSDDLAGINN